MAVGCPGGRVLGGFLCFSPIMVGDVLLEGENVALELEEDLPVLSREELV